MLSQAPSLYGYSANGANAVDPTTGKTYPKAYAGLFVPNTGNLNNGILYANTPGYPGERPTAMDCFGGRVLALPIL